MYWEHNWTTDGPVNQSVRANWQEKLQRQISGYVDTLFTRSARALGGQLKRGTYPRFYVFNPLNWTRSDIADLVYRETDPVRVIDVTTGKEAASQVIMKDGKRMVRIYAEAIPSVGYKVFELRPGRPTHRPVAATVAGETIRTARYRLRLSPSGAIMELYDSVNRRQLVKLTDGQYVNDLGVSNVNEGSPVVVENAGPVSVTLKAVSPLPVPHTVRVTLFANAPRIDIEDSIQANFNDVKTWAFSFNLTRPTTRHEEVGAILTAKKETRGGHYASQNARLDWQTFNHFADLSEYQTKGSAYGITLSNQDCSFFKLGHSTVDSLWEESAQLSALAGGQVDAKREDKGVLGIRGQNGQTQFLYKFALTAHSVDFDPVTAMKFSLEHQNPLITGIITGSQDRYPSPTFSLLKTSDPNLLLWTIKPSEDGTDAGLIARFWNLGNQPTTPTLTVASPISRAWQTTHIETNKQSLTPTGRQIRLRFSPNQLNTYRVQLAN